MDSSSGSSSPSMSMLRDLVYGEKEGVKSWLLAEMNSLVDPLIDSLFHKLTTKLTNSLRQKQPGDGDGAQVTNSFSHNELSNFLALQSVAPISQPSTSFIGTFEQTSAQLNQQQTNINNFQSQINLNRQVHFGHQSALNSSVQSQRVSTNSGANFNNFELTNFKSQPIKQEIDGTTSQLGNQVQCPSFLPVQAANEQFEQHLANWADEDEDDEDCDCEDCLNGGIYGIKKEGVDDDDDSVEWIEKCDESSRPVKKPKMDNAHSNSGQTQCLKQTNNESTIFITLQLKCLLSNCEQMFGDKGQLDQHMLDAHSIRPFRCLFKDCAQSFSDRRFLREHIKQIHSNTREFACGYCAKIFTSYESLLGHITRFHHLGKFKCSFANCGFVGESKGQVFWHNNQHRPELVCQLCNYRTRKISHLKIHQQAHLGIKPFQCKWPQCEFASTHRQNTLNHIRIHLTRFDSSNPNAAISEDPKDYLEVVREMF